MGDLDVAVELVPREPDFERQTEANYRRVTEESARGRRFASIFDQLTWWHQEAMLFLRRRSRGLSLHDYGAIREIVDASPHRVVFPESAPKAAEYQAHPPGSTH